MTGEDSPPGDSGPLAADAGSSIELTVENRAV